jgi:hypothetical protein
MTPKENILQELSELNSSLSLNQQNVYTVPAGYFDGLSVLVLNRIKALEATNAIEELGHLSSMLGKMSKQIPYIVPQGYFEGLAVNVLQAIAESNINQDAKEELTSISPLLSGLKKDMPFSVPQGYFEGLAEKAMQSVQETKSNQTASEELTTLSPLLSGLKKEMPFAVPQGYFESLTENISREENKPTAKVLSLTSRKWFRYAAAAIVTGIIATIGFILIGDKKKPGGDALAKFTLDVKKMDETQKDDLIDFIDMNAKETAQVDIDTKTNEVKNLLQGISEEELNDFQEQTEDLEDVLMTN